MAAVIVSPRAKSGFQSTTLYQHQNTLRLILRNVTSHQYGRYEGKVHVPEPGSWGAPLLAYRTQGASESAQGQLVPAQPAIARSAVWRDAASCVGSWAATLFSSSGSVARS